MKLSDYMQKGQGAAESVASNEEVDAELRSRVRERLYKEVPSERLASLASLERDRAQLELCALVQQVIAAGEFGDLSQEQCKRISNEIVDMIVGMGPLEALLNDDAVTEIVTVGHKQVFYEKDGVMHPAKESFDSEEQLRLVVDRIVSPLGRRVDDQQPIVNARLPQGHRVNVVIPPVSMVGTALTIRKFRPVSYSLDEMVGMGSLSKAMARLLAWAVQSRKNIAVCGGTGGGKTTLLNALSQEIPHDERIITIEDAAELRFDTHPHVVRLEARMPNAEGRGEVTIRALVVNALRMRPDRIVVGECRSSEALDMLQAMTTGHDGSLTTLHAGSPQEAVARLVTMVRYGMDIPAEVVEAQVVQALDIIVQQDRTRDGRRRVTQIAMRKEGVAQGAGLALAGESCKAPYEPIVTWNKRSRRYEWHKLPSWLDDLVLDGLAKQEEVDEWKAQVPMPCWEDYSAAA